MSTLEDLLEKCSTDAARVTMLREALDLADAEHVTTLRRLNDRNERAEQAIANSRKLMRAGRKHGRPSGEFVTAAYAALDWRKR